MKPTLQLKGLEDKDLKDLRGYCLRRLIRSSDGLPSLPGVYIWRYWPSFISLQAADFLDTLRKWHLQQPSFSEIAGNSRIEAKITRRPFGFDVEGSILGIDVNSNKGRCFLDSINQNDDNLELLIGVLNCIASLSPPLYVGKANNLKNRLQDHINRKTELLNDIELQAIPFDDIYISFILDPVSVPNSSVTTVLEEIVQRLTNPPLTKRIG